MADSPVHEFDLEELLKVKTDSERVALLMPDAVAAKQQDGTTTHYSLSLPQIQLHTYVFAKMLSRALPDPSLAFGVEPTVDDWATVDKPDESAKRLVGLHRALGSNWTEFEQHHRRPFLKAMRYPPNHIRNSYETAFDRLLQAAILYTKRRHKIEQMADGGPIPPGEFKAFIPEELKRILQVSGKKLKPYLNSGSTTGLERLRPEFAAILERAGRNDFEFFMRDLRNYKFSQLTITYHGDDQYTFDDSYASGGSRLLAEHSLDFTIRDGVLTEPEGQRERRKYPVPVISPTITWSKDANGKRYYLGHEATTQLFGIQEPHDTLVGFMLALALSPEARKPLPSRVGLPGSNIQQQMREAQIPLLGLMARDKIMSLSTLYPALEKRF